MKKFQSLVLPRNAILLQHLIIQCTLYYLLSGRLREVKNRRKFQTFSSKSGRGRSNGEKLSRFKIADDTLITFAGEFFTGEIER